MGYTNIEIYNGALGILAELNDPDNNSDYEERAPYLIASFCTIAKDLDKRIRTIEGLDPAQSFSPVCLSPMDQFPLCDALVPAAMLYVASMLVIDYSSELSESLYDKYCDAISTLAAQVNSADTSESAVSHPIVQKYFYD